MFGLHITPAMEYIAETMTRGERQELVHECLLETRAQGLEPSHRSKELARQWVGGQIGFLEMADGIYSEAMKEASRKENQDG